MPVIKDGQGVREGQTYNRELDLFNVKRRGLVTGASETLEAGPPATQGGTPGPEGPPEGTPPGRAAGGPPPAGQTPRSARLSPASTAERCSGPRWDWGY